MYQSSLSNIHSTLSKQTVSDLNRIYTEGILSRVSQIDVKSIVEPLEAVFENIRSLAEVIDAEVLFRPMIEKMEELFDQLESGLARTSKAFGQMITAIPV